MSPEIDLYDLFRINSDLFTNESSMVCNWLMKSMK